MGTDTKTLEQVYEGCLSRDWPKLLDALEREEMRAIMHKKSLLPETGWFENDVTGVSIMWQSKSSPRRWMCTFSEGELNENAGSDNNIHKWLENKCLGFFDPSPKHLEPRPLDWSSNDEGSENYCSQGEWTFMACSDGTWAIMFESKHMAQDDEEGKGDMDYAKGKIRDWRVAHLNSMTGVK